jgi:O-antigen ligase/tetratricopeptide (TPR) repeat protein
VPLAHKAPIVRRRAGPVRPTPRAAPGTPIAERVFLALVCLTLLTPFVVFKQLLVPFATSSAFCFRILVELTFPLYVYLLCTRHAYRPSLQLPLTAAMLSLFAVNLCSAFLGGNVLQSIWGNLARMGGVAHLAHLVLLYFYIILLARIRESYLRVFLATLMAAGAAAAVHGLLIRLTHNHFLFRDYNYPRVSGTFGNPIFLASFLVIPIFLNLFYLSRESRRVLRGCYLAATIIEIYCVLLTGTRGALAGIAAAFVIGGGLYAFRSGSRSVRIASCAAFGAFVIVMMFALSNGARLSSDPALARVFNLHNDSSESRLAQWKAVVRGIGDRPLLGTGPERYYVVSNKYSGRFDASGIETGVPRIDLGTWFDRPHNYALEILLTTGVTGLIAYLCLLAAAVWSMARAAKAEIITAKEYCCLLAALVAYCVQIEFVFDSVGAGVAFFALLGIIGSLSCKTAHDPRPVEAAAGMRDGRMVKGFVAVTCMVAAAFLFVNASGMRLAAAVESGYLYSISDPRRSLGDFESVRQLPFVFDPVKYSAEYSDFAAEVAADELIPRGECIDIVNKALRAQAETVDRVPDDPMAYSHLADLYEALSYWGNAAGLGQAEDAMNRALKLAPGKRLLLLQLARIKMLRRDVKGAEAILTSILREDPEDSKAQLQLAAIYWSAGQHAAGLKLAEQTLEGYAPHHAIEIEWLGAAYESQGDYAAAAKVYERAVVLAPNSVRDYWRLANDYAKIGLQTSAIDIAHRIANADPSRKTEMDEFVASIQ